MAQAGQDTVRDHRGNCSRIRGKAADDEGRRCISAGALPFEKDSIRRAHVVSIEGTKVPIASPEDLIVMKILASRPRDLGDIEGILATNPKLDRRRVRRLVRQFSEVLEMPELNERLAALLSDRRRR